ncbi:MAG TPA: hypothetical protein VFP72_23145, partial [Kineosporiaceae bacterium]|nr:hypothetical protein [Kineosporiaceae bacterium]
MTAKRRRSAAVAVVTIVTAAALSGCSGGNPDYRGVCVDPQTQRRVNDDKCDDGKGGGGHGGTWVFYRSGSTVPAVGAHASGYSTSVPKGSTVA